MTPTDPDTSDLRAAFEELRLINRLTEQICRVRESNHIMEIVVGELVKFTVADQGVISLVSPLDEGELQTVVRTQSSDPEALPYKVSQLVSGWVLRNRRMLKIDDADRNREIPGLSSEQGKYKSILCHPMLVRDEAIGLVTLLRSAERGPFTDDHARVSGIFTSQSAQILAHARLTEELSEKNRLLEISRRSLHEENARLQSEVGSAFAFENIIGKSPAMRHALSLTSKFSTHDSPVLITGETGTGKELIARAIHYNSPRKTRPFVIKNCGVKTESLLESELFGHVKGAFTGAQRDRKGLFEEADGGTIFLDEIGDAPAATQMAILRVIQNGEIRPVGGQKTKIVNVRVLSATNKDLKQEIEAGNFREDLYYRLATFAIELPPLRQRTGDIPLLTHHLLRKLAITAGKEALSVAAAAMDKLTAYPWPGNVRQLENELERAAVICGLDGQIGPEHLSPELRAWTPADTPQRPYGGRLRDIVEQVEQDVIRAALEEHAGNILQTAGDLGLTRKGLKDKMARYGIAADRGSGHESKST